MPSIRAFFPPRRRVGPVNLITGAGSRINRKQTYGPFAPCARLRGNRVGGRGSDGARVRGTLACVGLDPIGVAASGQFLSGAQRRRARTLAQANDAGTDDVGQSIGLWCKDQKPGIFGARVTLGEADWHVERGRDFQRPAFRPGDHRSLCPRLCQTKRSRCLGHARVRP
jgi:hypothetical protein